MKNSVRISLEFYFKGRKHSLSMVLDLDEYIQAKDSIDSLYTLLARSNNLDPYSYEYEVMLAEDLVFSDATGCAGAYLKDGKFDFAAFEQALREDNLTAILSRIARDHLSVDDLSAQPDLKAALLEAYRSGQKS
jgi:hypothetical protein